MADYDDGWAEGHRVGPYGVTPQGTWAADAYQDPRVGSQPYQTGMSDGRRDRINEMGDSAVLDAAARQEEAAAAWQVHQQQGGGDG